MLEGNKMETEFKIPTHPASESLFSKHHAMTALLNTPRVAGVPAKGSMAKSSYSLTSAGRCFALSSSSTMSHSSNPSTATAVLSKLSSPQLNTTSVSLPDSMAALNTDADRGLMHLVSASPTSGEKGSHYPSVTQTGAESLVKRQILPLTPTKASTVVKNTPSPARNLSSQSNFAANLSPPSSQSKSPRAHTSRTPAEVMSVPQDDTCTEQRPTFNSEQRECQSYEQPFYFETDHLALKSNKDYHSLLRTVTLLEAQRTKAINDLDKFLEAQDKALEDPIAFVRRLQNKEDLGLPKPQKVAQLPKVAWENYTSGLALEQRRKHKHMTRHNRNVPSFGQSALSPFSKASNSSSKSYHQVRQGINRESPHPSTSTSQDNSSQDNAANKQPENFNKPWSIDEQKRLEELLVEYPPEEVEARRWEKIAKALGNRTMLQVASRVQKYFIKLAKAGLPIPGRMPNLSSYAKRSYSHRHQRHNRYLAPFSTFMASYDPPVHMPDDDALDDMSYGPYSPAIPQGAHLGSIGHAPEQNMEQQEEVSDDEGVPPELRDSEEYRQIMRLKRLRKRKIHEESGMLTRHIGFKCDSCNCEPIVGTRWHCTECPEDVSVDFCSDCIDMNYENDIHSSSHHLEPIQSMSLHIDKDYTKFTPTGYNYLDPNYMPAS